MRNPNTSFASEVPADAPVAPPASALHPAAIALLLLAIAAGLLAPIWTVRYPPIVDYPNHLATAFMLAHLKDPALHFRDFYTADWNSYPYLTMDVILVGLQRFVSIDLAGRLLLSLCVLSVPVAAWFFIRQANPSEENLALWSLLVSQNLFFFLNGFLNLQLGLALCLFTVGVWVRYLERHRLGAWCLLLLLTTGLYYTHLEAFGIAGFVMTAYCVLSRRRIRQVFLAWALFVPGVLFYLHAVTGLKPSHDVQFRGLGNKFAGLLIVVLGYSPALDFLTLAVVIGAVLWARYNPEFRWNRAWIGTVGCLFALYWVFPAAYGTATNPDRRVLPFLVVLGLAAVKVGQTRGRELARVAVLLFLLRASGLEWNSVSLQPHLAKLATSFAAIPNDARVLPLVGWAAGAPLVERHFWAYGMIQRGWFSPCLLHTSGAMPFQVRLQTYTPYGPAFGYIESADWKRIRADYDYVWAYGVPQFSGPLSGEGAVVFAAEDLQVFKMGGRPMGHVEGDSRRSDELGKEDNLCFHRSFNCIPIPHSAR